jgi:protein-S-isoprenylcysteine O-methyltransferase Ste14
MPPSGAVFTIALIWVLQIRLALAEEPFLQEKFGATYAEYKARVPRFLPMIAAQWPAGGQQPKWLQAIAGELYFVLVVLVMAVFGWTFNAQPLLRGILISLGLWIVVRAFLPAPEKS